MHLKYQEQHEELNMKDEKLKLSDGSYDISNIDDHLKYFIKKHETLTNQLPIQTYVNKIQNRVKFKIKSRYYLEHLTPVANFLEALKKK